MTIIPKGMEISLESPELGQSNSGNLHFLAGKIGKLLVYTKSSDVGTLGLGQLQFVKEAAGKLRTFAMVDV
jgi:hypothetical protein